MPDKTLEFLIRTKADVSGATQARDALADTTKATDKAGEAAKEASKSVEKHALSHRELNEAIHLALPGIGEESRVLAHLGSPAGPALVAALAIGELIKVMRESGKEGEEAASIIGQAWQKYLEEAAVAANQLTRNLAHAEDPADRLNKKFEEGETIIEAEVKAVQELIKLLEQSGKLPPGTSATFDTMAQWRKMQREQQQQQFREQQEPLLKAAVEGTASALDAAKNPFLHPEVAKAQAALKGQDWGKITRGKYQGLSMEQALEQARAEAAEEAANNEWKSQHYMGEGAPMLSSIASDRLAVMEEFKRNSEIIAQHSAEVDKATEAHKNAVDAEKKNAAAIESSAGDLNVHRRTFFAGQAEKDIATAMGIADKGAAGGKLSTEEQQVLITVGTEIAGHSVTLQQAQTMLRTAETNTKILTDFVDRLGVVFDRMGDKFAAFERRFEDLEARIANNSRPLN